VDPFPETVPVLAWDLVSELATPAFKAPSLTGELL
jgi:hypothetical protein